MKKVIFIFSIFCFCGIAYALLPAREFRDGPMTRPINLLDNGKTNDTNSFDNLQKEIIKLRVQVKEQNRLIGQLKTECIKLKKENKMMRKTILDANLPLPDFRQLEQEQQKFEEEQQKQATIEKSEESIQPYFSLPLSVGQIARLGYNNGHQQTMKTIQIIDSNNMIVELSLAYISYTQKPPYYGEPKLETAWVKGFNTKNMADDQKVEVGEQAFKITGTKTYNAKDGTMTVFVLEPFYVNK